jgi:hypothetical protein
MPFNNDIAGGNGQLVRNWLQSQNYVAGVSGWRIAKDGSAEFNNGTFRGSIEVGSLTGQHFWVNNPNTGDVIDVYNSSNALVMSIDKTGRFVASSTVTTAQVVIVGGDLFFEDAVQGANLPPFITGNLSPDITELQLFGGRPANTTNANGAFLTLHTGDTQASEYIAVEQGGIQGRLIQTDVAANINRFRHADTYSGTTDNTGHLVFNHGCNFTPAGAIVTGMAPSVGTFPNLTIGTDGFTSTLANFTFIIANTNVFYTNASVMFSAEFFG